MPLKQKKRACRPICLINPSSRIAYAKMEPPAFPPMGIQYLASMLEKHGFEVKLIDIDAAGLSLEQLGEMLAEINPFFVGITCTTPVFNQVLELCKLVKISCGAFTCFGGVHPTIMPLEGIDSKFVDFIVFGEGEYTFLELVQALEAGKKDFSGIKGLVFKKNGKPIKNQPRPLVKNLDDLPFPARHLFAKYHYNYPDAMRAPTFAILTSRGCPGQCTYCCTKCIFGLTYRFRSADNIIEEIEQLIGQYGAKEIHIWDDNFTANKERVFEFCRKVKARGIHKKVLFSIPQGLRIDHVNEEILEALRSINVYSIGYGVESGNDEILRLCKKNITTEMSRKVIKMSKELGFDVWCFFIFGLYGETEETMRQTIDFAKELDPTFAKFLILKPLPGTEAFEQFKKDGLILETDYEKFGFYSKPIHRLPGISPERLMEIHNQAFKEFYFRPGKILQQVLRLKSWHRIKTNMATGFSIAKLTVLKKITR